MVGRTQEGYRYQPVRFVDHMKVKCKTVSVVTGPPEPPEPWENPSEVARAAKRLETQRFAAELTEAGLSQAQIASEVGVSERTVRRLLRAYGLSGGSGGGSRR